MKFQKVNESFSIVKDLTIAEKAKLDKLCSIKEPNHDKAKSFKLGIWDGKRHFYNKDFSTIPNGLIPDILHHFPKSEFDSVLNYDYTDYNPFIDNINLNKEIIIRDYQLAAVKQALNKKKCILQAATSAGKSLIIWILLKVFLEKMNKKVLIVVPQTQLVDQLYSDFEFYGELPCKVGKSTEKIIKKTKYVPFEQNCIISTWQKLQHCEKDFFNQFDVVLVDEVHGLDGKIIQNIVDYSINAHYRIGLTGTLKLSTFHEILYKSYFFKIIKIISGKELIDRGYATKIEVFPIELYHKKILDLGKTFLDEQYAIAKDITRISFIAKFVKKLIENTEQNNTLILFKSIENGFHNIISDYLKKYIDNVFIVTGSTKLEDRKNTVNFTENNINCVILASYPTFSTGINLKNLHNIIFAESVKSPIRIGQSLGRGMRKHKSKKVIRIFDIADFYSGTKKGEKNKTRYQYYSRKRLYNEYEYEIKKPKKITLG